MSEVYTKEALAEKKPKGEVKIEGADGVIYQTFVCHGCQSCFYFTDDECEKMDQHYPHFIAPLTPVVAG